MRISDRQNHAINHPSFFGAAVIVKSALVVLNLSCVLSLQSNNHTMLLFSFSHRLWITTPILLFIIHIIAIVEATEREYYIAAEEIEWDYAPKNHDLLHDLPLESSPARFYTVRNETRIGKVYHKAMYYQYHDNEFRRRAARDPAMGFIGPVIRGEAGDRLRITFFNRAKRRYSIHPYVSDLATTSPSHVVEPGEKYTYIWDVPVTINDTRVWCYMSRADPVHDVHDGLLGPVVIYPANTLQRPTPGSPERPSMLDREIFTVMTITDENMSHYIRQSAEAANVPLARDPGFFESNRMYHINGFVFNNNPSLHMYYGDRVRWYILSLGLGDDDPHTAHWHGATLLQHGHRMDVVDLMPVSFEWLDMMPDNEGQWLFHCHVTQHFDAGMSAFYQVEKLEYNGAEGWDEDEG